MMYRVRCLVWQIDAQTKDEAKKEVCAILKTMPEKFIVIEDPKPKRGILKSFFLGPA